MKAHAGIDRRVPWLEGAALALTVLLVLTFGGEAVRASYHGYLKASIGEAVLRDGLYPENPHHAGTVLRYYTLYPLLAVLLGRLGPGPLWGFAALNVISALLFAPALDALGRAFGLDFRARRAAFLAAVIGFNGLGWIGFAFASGEPFGRPPVFVLMPMTLAQEAFGWDGRLQAFVTKYFNVSSHTLTLPFALWSLAACLPRGERPANPWRTVLPAAGMLTMNPLIGGVAGVCMLVWIAPTLARGTWPVRGAWIGAASLALALALPFLLPTFHPAPSGPDLSGDPALGGHRVSNVVGPLLALLVPGLLGLRLLAAEIRWRWIVAVVLLSACVVFLEAPERSEYKLSRVAALLWALPCGAWCSAALARRALVRAVPWLLLVACIPTTLIAAWAYLAWGRSSPPLPLRVEHGRLTVDPGAVRFPLSRAILEAEAAADPRAVVVMHPYQPGTAAESGLVQGNALAPVLRHPLFVDWPQIHNEGQPDLADRMDEAMALWEGRGAEGRPESKLAPADALARIRARLSDRPLLVISHDSAGAVADVLARAGATRIAHDSGYALWSLPALGP